MRWPFHRGYRGRTPAIEVRPPARLEIKVGSHWQGVSCYLNGQPVIVRYVR